MKIVIEFIPGKTQRYPTVGDYWIDDDGNWQIRVSQMRDKRSEIAVALHELFEMGSVMHVGIPIEKIDEFDIKFEVERESGEHPVDSEPGDDPLAPYHRDHVNAEVAERIYCAHNELTWAEHSENCADA